MEASSSRASTTGVSSRTSSKRFSNSVSSNSFTDFNLSPERYNSVDTSVAAGKVTAPASSLGVFSSLATSAAVFSSSSTNATTSSRDSLMKPCDKQGSTIYCCVQRDKSGFNCLHPYYKCYMELNGAGFKDAQDDSPATSDRNDLGGSEGCSAAGTVSHRKLVMCAKKRSGMKTSSYLISMDENPDRGSNALIGKVRGDTVGSTYTIYDGGLSYAKTQGLSSLRCEYGLVKFQFDSGGPCTIQAWVPAIDPLGRPALWQPSSPDSSIEAVVARQGGRGCGGDKKLERLVNKKPKWDDTYGGHVLNFQGRVTESSVKNFQLLCTGDESSSEDIVLQFGRTGKDSFAMDVRYPLSLYQAFAIVVVCMDEKLADRKGYEYFRMLSIGNSNNNGSWGGNNNKHDEDDFYDRTSGGAQSIPGIKSTISNIKDYFTKDKK